MEMTLEQEQASSGFNGTIDYIRLIDLIQVSCLAKMSRTVKVDSSEATGKIYLDSGNVVHAESTEAHGEDGFYEMLGWDGGHFETLPLPEDVTPSISRAWEYLLIEAIRLHREDVAPQGEKAAAEPQNPSRAYFGTINDIGLTDLVQLICMDNTDRIVEVHSDDLTGRVHIRGGQVCHAETGDLKGEQAFFRMLSVRSGTFVTLPDPGESEVTINMPWEYLLIEAMRYMDESSGEDDEEETKKKAESLLQTVRRKKVAEKIRLAMTGDKETRNILIRDSSRMVQLAVIANPKITDSEVAAISYYRQVDEEVLRRIASQREWIKLYPVRLALATNPKTPLGIATKLISTLNRMDLKNISRSKSVPTVVANEARRLVPNT
ncbi:MAG: DUF4388 domain-containing protein [Syntrophobacter sp.]